MPIPHATLAALIAGSTLALVYAGLGRRSLRSAAAVLVALSALVWGHVEKSSAFSRTALPEHADWVDRARPAGETILVGIGGDRSMAALQTTFHNHAIRRVYGLCWGVFGADAGEREVGVDDSGSYIDSSGPVRAAYAVVPTGLGVRGRVVARDPQGHQELVELPGGRLATTADAGVPRC